MAGELVGPAAANGQMWESSTFEFDVLGIPLVDLALSIFLETKMPDLSNGVGPISVYALLKKLSGVQGRPHEHPNLGKPENLEF